MITTVLKSVEDSMNNRSVTEETISNGIEDFLQSASNISSLPLLQCLSNLCHPINPVAEDEHILLSNLLSNLNICSVHRADDQGTIHDEFHIGRARSFCAGG